MSQRKILKFTANAPQNWAKFNHSLFKGGKAQKSIQRLNKCSTKKIQKASDSLSYFLRQKAQQNKQTLTKQLGKAQQIDKGSTNAPQKNAKASDSTK